MATNLHDVHESVDAQRSIISTLTPNSPPSDRGKDNEGVGKIPAFPERPYSIFTRREKWFIVSIASFAGLFSPLTANIYLPAIPAVSVAFHKSTELINLTVTVYIVFQGISPMFWGTLSDRLGRRPIFLACLLLLALSCVGLALVPTSTYWLLLLLRCIQAAGSASTIALGAGIISDISTPAERGGFFGLYNLGPMVGPTIGPVIGGALADKAIFWFLCIATTACLIFMALFQPETLRCLVGDGSITPSPLYRPFVPIIGRARRDSPSTEKPPPRPATNPLRLFTYPDVLLMLFFNGIVYSVFVAITTTISTLFQQSYPFLDETDIGLCFLAIGGGMLFGSIFTGKFLDRDYEAIKQKMIIDAVADTEKRISPENVTEEANFPIERARLRTLPVYLFLFVACCIGYGWCLQKRVQLAGPLILQIAIGYMIVSVMNTTQTLIIDLVPSQGSSVTACNNFVRCSLGAASVSVIDLIVGAMGIGWTFVLLAGICVLVGPSIWLEMRIGPGCRARRRARNSAS